LPISSAVSRRLLGCNGSSLRSSNNGCSCVPSLRCFLSIFLQLLSAALVSCGSSPFLCRAISSPSPHHDILSIIFDFNFLFRSQ
jgi:hypothetical protein